MWRCSDSGRCTGITGDPYAEEPWCGYVPGSFPHQAELAALLPGAGDGGNTSHEDGDAGSDQHRGVA